MYEKFFGFRERPFQLVPNPAYLFLSRSHEEALAHLTYAVSNGDGFVEITGEVGTGKTTLCRVFLEELGDTAEVAYIFNPMLDAVQLLKTVNDEFGIDSGSDSVKELIDTLNAFLIRKKTEKRQVLLLIDEAQNLKRDVLEQIRLLSNLETDTSKLIQIILVGQPELRELLDSHDLRQLSQRITLSCHLSPLNLQETKAYIQHRLQVAAQKPGIRFTGGAVRTVFHYSGGIPRLVNIACDRALLTAFGLNKQRITGSIARTAIRELASRGDIRRRGFFTGAAKPALALSAIAAVVTGAFFFLPERLHLGGTAISPPPVTAEAKPENKSVPRPGRKSSTPETEARASSEISKAVLPPSENLPEPRPESASPSPPVSEAEEVQPAENQNDSRPATDSDTGEQQETDSSADLHRIASDGFESPSAVMDLSAYLSHSDLTDQKEAAFQILAEQWGNAEDIRTPPETGLTPRQYFSRGAGLNKLLLYRIDGNWDLIGRLNLPAVLELRNPQNRRRMYFTVMRMDDRRVLLGIGDRKVETDMETLASCWTGRAYVFWRNFMGIHETVDGDASSTSIVTLKTLLKEIGFVGLEMTPTYDRRTREAVMMIQERNGVEIDGAVGPVTKIVLYNELKRFETPKILGG